MSDLTHHDCPRTKAAVINGEYIEGCAQCLNTTQVSTDYAAKWKRERSKENHRADIVQRYDGDKINPEWVKLYEAKARSDLGDETVNNILRHGNKRTSF